MSAPLPLLSRSLVFLIVLAATGLLATAGLLGLEGYLGLVWLPILAMLFGSMVFPFVLLPAAIFSGLWQLLRLRHSAVAPVLAVVSVAYIVAILCLGLWFVLVRVEAAEITGFSSFFLQCFVVCAATAPWAVFALEDRRNILFILICWLFFLSAAVLSPWALAGVLTPACYALAVGACVLAGVGLETLREKIGTYKEQRAAAARDAAAPRVRTPDAEQ